MSETVKERNAAGVRINPYLFKGFLDGILYLIAYFGLPLYSVVNYINHENAAILFTALSCCFGVMYDCFSRYGGSGRLKTIKLWIIGVTNAALFVYTIYGIQLYIDKRAMLCPYVYFLLAVAPVVGIWDLILMVRDDVRVRR